MNPEVKTLAEQILQQVQWERETKINERSIGYATLELGGNKASKWLLRDPRGMQSRIIRDINGCVIGTEPSGFTSIYTNNNCVFRDSFVGKLALRGVGLQSDTNPEGRKISVAVTELAKYSNSNQNQGDAISGYVHISGAGQAFKFSSLYESLEKLKELQEDVQAKKSQLDQGALDELEAAAITQQIIDQETEIFELGSRIKQYIATEVSLRDQPILDEYQEAVKRSKPLNGPLIINGGPGTGKTTSLIQRISFLTAPTIVEEYGKLSKEKADLLFNAKTAWIFYSPSELLRDYLATTMRAEGLPVSEDSVITWAQQRIILLRSMALLNPETQRPFTYRKKLDDSNFFKPSVAASKMVEELFEQLFLDQLTGMVSKVFDEQVLKKLQTNLDFTPAEGKREKLFKLALKIQDSAKRADNFKALEDWIPFFINTSGEFGADLSEIRKGLNQDLDQAASMLLVAIRRNDELDAWIKEIVQTEWEKRNIVDSDPEEDEFDEEDEVAEAISGLRSEQNLTTAIQKKLKSYLRQNAMREIDKTNNQLSSKNKELHDKLENLLNRDKLKELGIQAYFLKHYGRLTRGFEANMLGIPTLYKRFRSTVLRGEEACLTKEGLLACEFALKNQNRPLHAQEADFILSFSFKIIKGLYRKNRSYYLNSQHSYVVTYREYSKAVVAVDEATDFSIFELKTMSSLAHPEFDCVTLSGDLMQRMTSKGISSWEDFQAFLPDAEVKDLKIAYRQTAKLLKVAAEIYSWNVSQPAEFVSYQKEDIRDPQPIYIASSEVEIKLRWMVDRILEVQRAYGQNFPSLAIFVENDAKASELQKKLDDFYELEEVGLNVVACLQGKVLGDKRSVRIFSVEYIKGLEFAAVLFWDLDRLSGQSEELLNKYIYVGLSRANLFLGVTLEKDFSDDLAYLKEHFKEGGWDLGKQFGQ